MNKKMTNIETKRTKREELIYLYTLESAKVNLELASNIDTPLCILKELSKDSYCKDILKDNISFKKYRTLLKDIYFRKLDIKKQEFIIKMFRFIKEKREIEEKYYKLAIKLDYIPLLKKIASNHNTPSSVLELLAKDESFYVRCEVAKNKKITKEFLELLAKDESFYVRYEVAKHPNSNLKILEFLAKDESYLVRETVAANKKINLEIIKKLINDNSCIVRRQLFANLRILLLEDKNNEEIKEIKEYLASSMNTYPDILEKLAKDEYYSVRSKVAKNLNTTEEILEILAKDESFMIRYEVTQNPNSNLETLELLTKDKDKFVKHFAKISFNKFKKNSLIK